MKKDIINVNFLAALTNKAPNRTKLANTLVNILQIEKEAVYRRLRKEVPFTFAEVALVSEKLGISLDNIIGITSLKDRPLVLKLSDFDTPQEFDFNMWENYIDLLKILRKDPNSISTDICNILPFPLCYKYIYITTFYTFRWRYHYKSNLPVKSFDEIIIPNRLREIQLNNLYEIEGLSQGHIILDPSIFSNIIHDILYFKNIKLISQDNINQLKKDLLELILYLEHLAITGKYDETGNSISLYVSGISIDTNYSYLETKEINILMIKLLSLSGLATNDEISFNTIKNWMNALKRVSTLISVSGEKQRIEYINVQRNLINQL